MPSLYARFMAKIRVNPETACWEWTAAIGPKGYGYFRVAERVRLAHRVSYEIHVGEIPAGLELDHLCRVRHCVNPMHLEPVTGRVNKLRGTGFNAVNAAKTHCDSGHEFNETNTYNYRGRRQCRPCNAAATRAYRKRKAMK